MFSKIGKRILKILICLISLRKPQEGKDNVYVIPFHF